MEALWNLEDKWKLSTQEALFLFTCTAFAVVGICAATVLKRKAQRKQLTGQETNERNLMGPKSSETGCGWVSMKRVLMSSVRWSRPKKWAERNSESWRERPPPLLGTEVRGLDVGWQSHNSASAVWQRPILMGEKCELPRFSGLILYDERGRLLHELQKESSFVETGPQEKSTAVVKTTLRDLL